MKNQPINILYWTYLALNLLLFQLVLAGNMTFGHGLGDLFMLLAMGLLLLVIGLAVCLKSKVQKYIPFWNLLIGLAIIMSLVYFLLSLTIWRGPEMGWNGKIFI